MQSSKLNNSKALLCLRPIFGIEHVSLSLILALLTVFLFRKIPVEQTYPDFVVGYITWNAANKSIDYYSALVFLFSFFIVLVVTNFILHRVGKKEVSEKPVELTGGGERNRGLSVFIMALIPAGWWLGAETIHLLSKTMVVPHEYADPSYLYLLMSGGTLLTGALVKLVRSEYRGHREHGEVTNIVGVTSFAIPLGFLAGLAISTAIGRCSILPYGLAEDISKWLCFVSSALVLLALGAIYAWSRDIGKLKERLAHLLVWVQLPFPLFFLILIPGPWWIENVLIRGYQINLVYYVVLTIAIILGFVAWFRKWRGWTMTKDSQTQNIESLIIPGGMVALLIFIHSGDLAYFPSDDYHFGEWLLPWQQLVQFGEIPFANLNYPHGLLHLIHGFFTSTFFGGSTALFEQANMLLVALGIAVTFFAINTISGPLIALVIMFTFPLTKINSLNLLFIAPALLTLAHPRVLNKPVNWLMVWILLSTGLVLYAMSTGTAFVLATLPAAVWITLRAIRIEHSRFKKVLVIGMAVAVGGIFVTPLGKIIQGMRAFLAENSAVNSVANGIPWKASVMGMVGLGWIIIAIILALLVWEEFFKKEGLRRTHVLIFGLSVLLYLMGSMPYALGRIDPGGASRTGMLSIWAVYLGLPLMVLLVNKAKNIKYFLLLFPVIGSAVYVFSVPSGIPSPNIMLHRPFEVNIVASKDLFSEHRDTNQREDLVELKYLLSRLLKPGETYLDLTNHSARYFYLGYPVPVLEAAFYNAPATKTQLRMLKQIALSPPPVVLAEGENILFDGGSAALRANLIYRHFVLSYVPLKWGRFILLVEPSRAKGLATILQLNPSLKSHEIRVLNTKNLQNIVNVEDGRETRLCLLDKAFRVEHLEKIPISWGRSWKTLAPLLTEVAEIQPDQLVKGKEIVTDTKDSYFTSEKDSELIFNVTDLKLRGSDAAFVSFDFCCRCSSEAREHELGICWKANHSDSANEKNTIRLFVENGRILVPLDSSPRWLLSEQISEFRISLGNDDGREGFSVRDVKFFQRRILGI